MLSRKRLFQAFAGIGLGLTIIAGSNRVEFSTVQAARIEPNRTKQPETLTGVPLSLPDDAISLAPSSLLTTTVTAAETEAEPVDITIRETP